MTAHVIELTGTSGRTLSHRVREGLAETGAVLVRDFPGADDAALLELGNDLGFVSARGNGNPPRQVHHVTAGQAIAAPHGLGSRSHREFALHTDSCGYPCPHALVMLACVTADPEGQGVSLLVDGQALAAGLPPEHQAALQQTGLPFWPAKDSVGPVLHAPILEADSGRWRVRYRGDSLVRTDVATIGSAARSALVRFENAMIDAEPLRLLLQADDVLVIDNRRILHGREPFPPGSPRLLKRLKIHTRIEDEHYAGPPCLW